MPSPSTKGTESAEYTGPPPSEIVWPVGAEESSSTSIVASLVFAGVHASAAVTTIEKSPAAAGVQLNGAETKGPAAGAATVSRACVQPVSPTAGYVADAGPEPESTTALESVNEPAEAGR
jgi:hypothetical protein